MNPAFRISLIPALLPSATMLAGCATNRPPEIRYDASVLPLPAIPAVVTDERLKPIHVPPTWAVARGGPCPAAPRRLLQCHSGLSMVGRRALSNLCRARSDHQHRARTSESLAGAGPIAAGKHRPLDYGRYRWEATARPAVCMCW